MPLSQSLPKLARTLSRVLERETLPSPHGSESLPIAPPPTPNVPSTPVAEDDNADKVLRPKAGPSPGPNSVLGQRHGSPSSGRGIDDRGRISFLANLDPTLVLENTGSVARDHLASERTFLAYVRTSLTIATSGVALVQLFTVASNTKSTTVSTTVKRIQHFARPLGATMVAFGLAVLAFGVYRYFIIQSSLSKGVFPITRFGVAGIAIILAVVVVIVFAVLVSGKS